MPGRRLQTCEVQEHSLDPASTRWHHLYIWLGVSGNLSGNLLCLHFADGPKVWIQTWKSQAYFALPKNIPIFVPDASFAVKALSFELGSRGLGSLDLVPRPAQHFLLFFFFGSTPTELWSQKNEELSWVTQSRSWKLKTSMNGLVVMATMVVLRGGCSSKYRVAPRICFAFSGQRRKTPSIDSGSWIEIRVRLHMCCRWHASLRQTIPVLFWFLQIHTERSPQPQFKIVALPCYKSIFDEFLYPWLKRQYISMSNV